MNHKEHVSLEHMVYVAEKSTCDCSVSSLSAFSLKSPQLASEQNIQLMRAACPDLPLTLPMVC